MSSGITADNAQKIIDDYFGESAPKWLKEAANGKLDEDEADEEGESGGDRDE